VAAIGTHTVAAWSGRFGTAHATRPTTAAATGTAATASASAKESLQHPSSPPSANVIRRTGRGLAALLPPAAGQPRRTSLSPHHV